MDELNVNDSVTRTAKVSIRQIILNNKLVSHKHMAALPVGDSWSNNEQLELLGLLYFLKKSQN